MAQVASTVSFAHHISSTQYDSAPCSNGDNSLDVLVRVVQVGSQGVVRVEELHRFTAGISRYSIVCSVLKGVTSDEMRVF